MSALHPSNTFESGMRKAPGWRVSQDVFGWKLWEPCGCCSRDVATSAIQGKTIMMQILGGNHQQQQHEKQPPSSPAAAPVPMEAPLPAGDRQKLKRSRRGECAECGTKLFQKTFGSARKEINVPGKSFNGRCLVCFPVSAMEKATGKLASASEAEANRPKIPETISFSCAPKEPHWIGNGGTVPDGAALLTESLDDNVSEITLDRKILIQPDDAARIASVGTSKASGFFRKSKRTVTAAAAADGIEQPPANIISKEENDDVTEEIRSRMQTLLHDPNDLVPWEVPPLEGQTSHKKQWETPVLEIDQDLQDLNPTNMVSNSTTPVRQSPRKSQKWAPAMFVPPVAGNAPDSNDIVLDVPGPDDQVARASEEQDEEDEDGPDDDLAVFDPTDFAQDDEEVSLEMLVQEEESPDEYSEYSSKLLKMLEGGLNEDSKPPPLAYKNDGDDEKVPAVIPTSEETTPVDMEISNVAKLPGNDDGFNVKKGRKKPPPNASKSSAANAKKAASPKKPPPLSITAELRLSGSHHIDDNSTDLILLLGRLEHGRAEDHDSAMKKLTQQVWDQGVAAKTNFVANDGVRILTAVMWSDMDIIASERSAMSLFLALVSSEAPGTSHVDDDLMTHPDSEGLVDALLIVMQTLASDGILQETGCKILAALAVKGGENDGTQSGACLAVMNAIDAHFASPSVQEWGLRALLNQCTHSAFAAANKRTLLSSKLAVGDCTGAILLERIILSKSISDASFADGSILDWDLQLCWCLTSSPEVISELVSLRIETMRDLLILLERGRSVEHASADLQESILGIFSNRVRMTQYRDFLGTVDVLLLILDVMHGNKSHLGIQIEACNMIANVSTLLSPQEKDEFSNSGAVQTIVGALFAFEKHRAALQESALRALVGLSIKSEMTKELICETDTLSVIMQTCRPTDVSIPQHEELLCALLASVFANERAQKNALEFDTVFSLAQSAGSNLQSEKIHEAVCTAYRNICTSRLGLDLLLRHKAVDTILHAMRVFKMSKSIQMNGCATLCRIGLGTTIGHEILYEAGAMRLLLNAIQMHLDTQEVTDMALEALWCLLSKFPELGDQFLEIENSIESVLSVFLMHGRSPLFVERACGILACGFSSGSPAFTPGLVSDGIENVIDALANNPECFELQLHSVYFLRKAIIENPPFTERIRGAIPFVLDALKIPAQSDMFLHEACSLLWVACERSSDMKSQVLSLGGQAVLMDILNHRGMVELVERAAVGVLDELRLNRHHHSGRHR